MSELSSLENQDRKQRSRWAEIFWPQVDDLESARSAARQGLWVTLAMLAIVLIYTGATLLKMKVIDLIVMVLWAAFLGLIALGIRKMWRPMALLGFVTYACVSIASLAQGSSGGLLMLLITLAYGNSVRGTFAYHRLCRPGAREPEPE